VLVHAVWTEASRSTAEGEAEVVGRAGLTADGST